MLHEVICFQQNQREEVRNMGDCSGAIVAESGMHNTNYVVYTIDAMGSNSMKSSNPHSGIHETQIAKCLDTMCLDPSCNQGGHIVVISLEGNGSRKSHMGKSFSENGTMYTLNTIERHSVCYEK